MRKWFIVAAAIVAVGIPAAYAAVPNNEKPARTEDSDAMTAKTCKAERKAMSAEAFAKQYGKNHNRRNAFGKCVSSKSKAKAKDKEDKPEGD